jgi:hypothetical protein
VLHEHVFSGLVAVEHRAQLRNGHMRLVDKQQVIFREIVDQRPWLLAGFSAVQVAGVVFHAGAIADFLEHFDVVFRAGLETLGLQQLALVFQFDDAHFQFVVD